MSKERRWPRPLRKKNRKALDAFANRMVALAAPKEPVRRDGKAPVEYDGFGAPIVPEDEE